MILFTIYACSLDTAGYFLWAKMISRLRSNIDLDWRIVFGLAGKRGADIYHWWYRRCPSWWTRLPIRFRCRMRSLDRRRGCLVSDVVAWEGHIVPHRLYQGIRAGVGFGASLWLKYIIKWNNDLTNSTKYRLLTLTFGMSSVDAVGSILRLSFQMKR